MSIEEYNGGKSITVREVPVGRAFRREAAREQWHRINGTGEPVIISAQIGRMPNKGSIEFSQPTQSV